MEAGRSAMGRGNKGETLDGVDDNGARPARMTQGTPAVAVARRTAQHCHPQHEAESDTERKEMAGEKRAGVFFVLFSFSLSFISSTCALVGRRQPPCRP